MTRTKRQIDSTKENCPQHSQMNWTTNKVNSIDKNRGVD